MKTIELTQGKVAIVDDEDFVEVSKYKWSFDSNGYARRCRFISKNKGEKIYLHRFLMGVNGFYQTVDHINGDRLDCRRCNLRFATRGQNNINTSLLRKSNSSGYRGVCKIMNRKGWNGRWKAQIQGGGKGNIWLGSFDTKEDAARAYNEKAKELHGEFAVLNNV